MCVHVFRYVCSKTGTYACRCLHVVRCVQGYASVYMDLDMYVTSKICMYPYMHII